MQVLTPCRTLPLVILPSPERVSTPAAYTALDAAYADFATAGEHGNLPAMLSALAARDAQAIAASLYNIFESVILPTCPIAAANRTRLYELGAEAVLMSGSGATVFGVFGSEEAAAAAAASFGRDAVKTATV